MGPAGGPHPDLGGAGRVSGENTGNSEQRECGGSSAHAKTQAVLCWSFPFVPRSAIQERNAVQLQSSVARREYSIKKKRNLEHLSGEAIQCKGNGNNEGLRALLKRWVN